jgi:hypothetical protein
MVAIIAPDASAPASSPHTLGGNNNQLTAPQLPPHVNELLLELKAELHQCDEMIHKLEECNKALENELSRTNELHQCDERIHKLEECNKALENELSRTNGQFSTMEADVYDVLINEDKRAMQRIRARHLLNITQAHLAFVANLATNLSPAIATLRWRDRIGPRDMAVDLRVKEARRLLSMPSISLPAATRLFVDNDEAMQTVCTYESDICTQGDAAAHPHGPAKAVDYQAAVQGSRGLEACLELAVAISNDDVQK